jgi:hypothetical protein
MTQAVRLSNQIAVQEKREEVKSNQHTDQMTQAARLATQIAIQEKREEIKSHQRTEHYSTPATAKPPDFNSKLSPIDKVAPVTRINTQILVPIKENSSFDDQSQLKRRKIDDNISEFNSIKEDTKEDVCLSTIDDIQDDDLKF